MSISAISKSVADKIASIISASDPDGRGRAKKKAVHLHEPYFCGNEAKYVQDCIDSGWVSSIGKYVDKFETMLAAFTGASKAVAVVNGTAGLHIALLLSNVKAGDEVLVSPLNFIAPANAIAYCHANPHFVDVETTTLGIDTAKLSLYLSRIAEIRNGQCMNKLTGQRIKALIAVHIFGHPCNLTQLAALCAQYRIELVEDAAEALGSLYYGRHVGLTGKVGVLSFNGNKTVTTGGGGAIISNDPLLAERAKHITTTARVPHAWEITHDQTGFNYRMPNINAALGVAQLENLPAYISAKRTLAGRYLEVFKDDPYAKFFTEPINAKSNYWLNTIFVENQELRDSILYECSTKEIYCRPAWNLISGTPMYKNCARGELTVAEKIQSTILNMPSSVFLGL